MKPCIIYGHRVTQQPEATFGPDVTNCVSMNEFERLLDSLAGQPPAPDWVGQLARHEPGQQPFPLLTFDDGYEDIRSAALPLIEQYRVPCIIFVTTGFVDRELGDYESTLAGMLATARELDCPRLGRLELADTEARAEAYDRLRLLLKPRSRRARQRYIDGLKRLNPAVANGLQSRFLDWASVRELDRHPLVSIGAHSHSHILLSRPNPLEVYRELVTSRQRLEEQLQRRVDLLAYPYGAHTVMTRFLARQAGYRLGFATGPVTDDSEFNRMSIPRVDIHEYLNNLPV